MSNKCRCFIILRKGTLVLIILRQYITKRQLPFLENKTIEWLGEKTSEDSVLYKPNLVFSEEEWGILIIIHVSRVPKEDGS